MFRSIVSRSRPLLFHLRRRAAAPGGAILSSRSYASSSATDGTTAARHLYVVLEERAKPKKDHAMGRFSIYKLPDVDEDTVTDDQAPLHLPRAALHLSVSLVGQRPQFEALGSKIAIFGYNSIISEIPCTGQFITLLYDTKTGTMDAGRALQPDQFNERWIKYGRHAATPVNGDKLCVLETLVNKPFYLYEKSYGKYYVDEWGWDEGPSPLPLDATEPYDDDDDDISVQSHAVHPDGHTIFASSDFTFSLDTENNKSAWHGNWLLPFNGRAYYDGDLDAWVGIRLADGTEGGSIEGYSYLCVCDIPTALPGSRRSKRGRKFGEPAWKMCKEELTFVDAQASAKSPALIPTGHGRFCLVEINSGAEARVTMFIPRRDKNGELEVTPCLPGRSYAVPNYSGGFYTALWM